MNVRTRTRAILVSHVHDEALNKSPFNFTFTFYRFFLTKSQFIIWLVFTCVFLLGHCFEFNLQYQCSQLTGNTGSPKWSTMCQVGCWHLLISV